MLIGGQSETSGSSFTRVDYILEKKKDRFKLKTRKLEAYYFSLDLLNPAYVRDKNKDIWLYSVEENTSSRNNS